MQLFHNSELTLSIELPEKYREVIDAPPKLKDDYAFDVCITSRLTGRQAVQLPIRITNEY